MSPPLITLTYLYVYLAILSFIYVLAVTQHCDSSPCVNGGTCINSEESPICICPEGFEGVHCETNVNDCRQKPCYNGGQCVDGINWRMCKCEPGFTSPDCRIRLNQCSSMPCAHGSTCIDKVDGFRCLCPNGRTGSLCERIENFPLALSGMAPGWCQWAGDLKPHGSVWRHRCNTCHCSYGTVTCSTMWCGPENCLASLDSSYPCDPRQVCCFLNTLFLLFSSCN